MMQFNGLVINMKKLLLILMVATTLIAMATCIVCKKRICNRPIDISKTNNVEKFNAEELECDDNSCVRKSAK